jgi:HPt (histidine-containing phosphotransfer) domain-containing protein
MSHISPGQDLDLSFLYEIADGSNEFVVESIDMFLQHTPEMIQMITTSIASRDWTVAAAAAHKLKPNCGFFGMPETQAKIQEVELLTKSDAPDPELIALKFAEITATISANVDTLKKIKADLEAS